MTEPNSETPLDRVVRLAFGRDRARFDEFLATLRDVTPPGVEVILRGSAVSETRWSDGQPFDAGGPGTSDLDVTFLGADMLQHWESFYIPGLHTVPLSEAHPNACPPLVDLRRRLSDLAGRPVNLQASTGLVQFARDVLLEQPYVTLIAKETEDAGAPADDE